MPKLRPYEHQKLSGQRKKRLSLRGTTGCAMVVLILVLWLETRIILVFKKRPSSPVSSLGANQPAESQHTDRKSRHNKYSRSQKGDKTAQVAEVKNERRPERKTQQKPLDGGEQKQPKQMKSAAESATVKDTKPSPRMQLGPAKDKQEQPVMQHRQGKDKQEQLVMKQRQAKDKQEQPKPKDDEAMDQPTPYPKSKTRVMNCPVSSISQLSPDELHPKAGARHLVTPPDGGKVSLLCFNTTKGKMSVLIHEKWAPLGVERLLKMVSTDYFSSQIPLFRCTDACQFGIAGDPAVTEPFNSRIKDDPQWLPGGPDHRQNDKGATRYPAGFLTYAGSGPNTRSNQFVLTLKPNQFMGGGSPWEVPMGELVGKESFDTMSKLYTGYGARGPSQDRLNREGASDGVRRQFPLMDYIVGCSWVEEKVLGVDIKAKPKQPNEQGTATYPTIKEEQEPGKRTQKVPPESKQGQTQQEHLTTSSTINKEHPPEIKQHETKQKHMADLVIVQKEQQPMQKKQQKHQPKGKPDLPKQTEPGTNTVRKNQQKTTPETQRRPARDEQEQPKQKDADTIDGSHPDQKSKLESKECPVSSISKLSPDILYPEAGGRHMVTPPGGGKVSLLCFNTTKGSLSVLLHEKWAPLGVQRLLLMIKFKYFSSQIPLFRCTDACQFGISGNPTVTKDFNRMFEDDPQWLPGGPDHRQNDKGVIRYPAGFLTYAGSGPNSRNNQFVLTLKPNQFMGGGSPWEVPIGEVVGKESFDTMAKIYTGYGDKGPSQDKLNSEGASDAIRKQFPLMDFITGGSLIDEKVLTVNSE